MKETIESQVRGYLRWKLQVNEKRIDYIEIVRITKISKENAEDILLELYDEGLLLLYVEFQCEHCHAYINNQFRDEYLITCPTCSDVYDIREYVKGLDYYYEINTDYWGYQKKNVIPFRRELNQQIYAMSMSKTANVISEEEGIMIKEKDKIFIVHGHDEVLKLKLETWLWSHNIEPVVLHKKANGGTRSILDKIEKYSDVKCAIVLLTPDDEGKDLEGKDLRPRARQNVVFEAGYFMGKLGIDHVILLSDSSVDRPGDLGGCIYIDADENEGWKESIRIEFTEMGISM
nr:nucleotide-binding protein [uncultured Anaerosporobacter sp.]